MSVNNFLRLSSAVMVVTMEPGEFDHLCDARIRSEVFRTLRPVVTKLVCQSLYTTSPIKTSHNFHNSAKGSRKKSSFFSGQSNRAFSPPPPWFSGKKNN